MLRVVIAVIVGYAVMAFLVFATFSLLYLMLGADGAFRPGTFEPSTTWVVLSRSCSSARRDNQEPIQRACSTDGPGRSDRARPGPTRTLDTLTAAFYIQLPVKSTGVAEGLKYLLADSPRRLPHASTSHILIDRFYSRMPSILFLNLEPRWNRKDKHVKRESIRC